MKSFILKVTIHEGCDEWWDTNPTLDEVADAIREDLYAYDVEVEAVSHMTGEQLEMDLKPDPPRKPHRYDNLGLGSMYPDYESDAD